MYRYRTLIAALWLSLAAGYAIASSGTIPGGPHITDCGKARDPAQCKSRVEARTACQHKRGSSKRQCMDARKIAPECSAKANPLQCSQQQRAAHICRDKTSKAYKQCLSAETKKLSSRL